MTIDLFAPKKEIVGTPMMDEMWPSPLSVAKAYLHNEIKIILSLKLYLPHKEVMLTSLLFLIIFSASSDSLSEPKIK